MIKTLQNEFYAIKNNKKATKQEIENLIEKCVEVADKVCDINYDKADSLQIANAKATYNMLADYVKTLRGMMK